LFYNHGINVRGFGGDTMHMARLEDSSKTPGSYSLAALTSEYAHIFQLLKQKYIEKTEK
jgi:DNA polymerase-1